MNTCSLWPTSLLLDTYIHVPTCLIPSAERCPMQHPLGALMQSLSIKRMQQYPAEAWEGGLPSPAAQAGPSLWLHPAPPIAFPGQRAIGTGLAWRCPQSGAWAESSGLGIEGGGRRVALAGMLLAVQLVPHPEVPSHLQVQPTVSAAVAASVAVAPLLDADGLVPAGTGRGQPLACREGQECLARCHHSHSQGAWFPGRSQNLKHLTPQASRKPQPTPKGRQF